MILELTLAATMKVGAILITPPIRGCDLRGCGYYGAPRSSGNGTHDGLDFAALPGSIVYPTRPGTVTDVGLAYENDDRFWFVEVRDQELKRHRYFYVMPVDGLRVGEFVDRRTALGVVQDIRERYSGITPHYHYEVWVNGESVDPTRYALGEMK